MPLPDSWADALFAKLTVRYGAAFLRQYADVDAGAVKADWADVLGGLTGEAIRHALENLPTDRPPNAMQFRDACLKAPRSTPPALEAPKADPAKVKELVGKVLAGPPKDLSPAAHMIARLAGMPKLTQAQRDTMQAAMRSLRPADIEALRERNVVISEAA